MLLYADDIVFLASTAEGLQEQLETLNNWSTKWALNVNIDKTKVLHVRKASVALCEYRFKLGNLVVDYTSQIQVPWIYFRSNSTGADLGFHVRGGRT
jgi:hypothetical protein